MPPVAPTRRMSEGGLIKRVAVWVYILQSIPYPRQRYFGLAEDVQKRLDVHNSGGSSHTAKFKPWKIVIMHWFEDKSWGAAFERYLKSGSCFSFSKRHFM